MPSCVLRKCKNYGAKKNTSSGVSYHTFPSDELIKNKCVSIVKAERSELDWMPSKCSTICSTHFKDEDKFITPKGLKRLKNTAVPVIVQVENDTNNFIQFKLVGGSLRIKPNICPHKLDYQKSHEETRRMEHDNSLKKEVSSTSSESLSCERFEIIECDNRLRIKTEDPEAETHNVHIKKSLSDDELEEDEDETVSKVITTTTGAHDNIHNIYIKKSLSDGELEEDETVSKAIATSIPGAPGNVSISFSDMDDDGNLSASELSCSDVDEVLESPRHAMMRKELQKKTELLKKIQNKIGALQKKNGRLEKRVASLKNIVETYKKGKCCCHTKISDESDSDSKSQND
ncbi:uncharacterized protein LOC119840539 isoform X2 [Zerene cesonia]|uniref:uncharacterized protein LOC119840539 isoform X2 n=1 Tax=Zerene cesonia TaxID=33412 RepID=UPI0018E4F20F|nr:uncharacterized protein LOC119840539 isoform X2 [Zerene cesonia]